MYLDVASAAPWHPRALAAHSRVAEGFVGDPDRQHAAGRAARDLLERARGAVAEELGAPPDGVVFTGSGTQAVQLAITGAVAANRGRPRRILSCGVEHAAVLSAAEAAADRWGHDHVLIGVDRDGRVNVDQLAAELGEAGAALVNVQHANHEVGVIQPIPQVARLCRNADALLHVDACQTAGRLPVSLADLGADLVSISAAKFGGGRGVGAVLTSMGAQLADPTASGVTSVRRGSGVQDLPGIAAAAEALASLRARNPSGEAAQQATACDAVRRHLRAALTGMPVVEVHGPTEGSLPNLVAFTASAMEGSIGGQALADALDAAGWQVHGGSSCTPGGGPSHVLAAMGVAPHGHIRVSFDGRFTMADADRFLADLERVVAGVPDPRGR